MAGTYQVGQSKTLSGVYSLIMALVSGVTGSPRGIVAVPFTADWGPVNELRVLGRATEFDVLFNTKEGQSGIGTDTTAQKVRTLAYKALPNQVLGYRMATSSASKASATLAQGWTLETVYPTKRQFKAAVKAGVAVNAVTVQIVENGIILAAVEDTDPLALANKLNATGLVTVQAMGAALPATTAGVDFTGGDNGANVTTTEYSNFLAEIEADHTANGIALDGVTDVQVNAMFDAWLRRVRDEGLYITAARGGLATWDSDLTLANAASKALNYRGVINVGNGCDGYTSAEMAIFTAAYAASIPLNMGMTDQVVPFTYVNVKTPLNVGGRTTAKNSGTLLFMVEGGQVVIDEDVNTLTTAVGLESAEMGSIRINNTLDYIVGSLEAFGNEYKKSRSNTQEARRTYAALVESTFFAPLARQEVIQPGFTYQEDPDYHGKNAVFPTKLNQAFFTSTFTPVDSMEQIYQKFGVQF